MRSFEGQSGDSLAAAASIAAGLYLQDAITAAAPHKNGILSHTAHFKKCQGCTSDLTCFHFGSLGGMKNHKGLGVDAQGWGPTELLVSGKDACLIRAAGMQETLALVTWCEMKHTSGCS